jgi:hypothetical protein
MSTLEIGLKKKQMEDRYGKQETGTECESGG